MNSRSRLTNIVAATMLGVALAGAVGMIIIHQRGEHLLTVASNSMEPELNRGDLILIEPIAFRNIRIGDIVSYRPANQSEALVTHRIVAIDYQGSRLTLGSDRSKSPDPTIGRSQVIGRVSAKAPWIGRIVSFLRTPLGLLLAIYLPAIFLIAREVNRISLQLSRPKYLLDYNYDSEQKRQ